MPMRLLLVGLNVLFNRLNVTTKPQARMDVLQIGPNDAVFGGLD